MKKWLLGNLILIILVFLVWPDHKKEDEEFGVMRDPISDLGYADPSDIEFNRDSFEGINNENAITYVEEFYGLELNIPETWKLENVVANKWEEDSKVELSFSNATDEEYNTYVSDFYTKHHLGDDDLSKFKLKDGISYSWTVQIEGVSIKDIYSFNKVDKIVNFTIEKNF